MQQCFYVLRVPSQKERAAETHLKRRGYRALVPMQLSFKRTGNGRARSGSREPVKRPAVPGYVFVLMPTFEPPLWELRRFNIIKSVMTFDGQPGRISEGVMADFLQALGEKPKEERYGVTLRKGSAVRIKEGAFVGFNALVDFAEGARAKVLIDLFGRSTEIEIAAESLEPMAANSHGKRAKSPRGLTGRGKSLYASHR